MDSPTRAEAPKSLVENGRHTSYSSDNSTVCGNDFEKDLESQQIKPTERSLSNLFGLAQPVSDNLDDIDEEDLAESEVGEKVDVNAMDYQRST